MARFNQRQQILSQRGLIPFVAPIRPIKARQKHLQQMNYLLIGTEDEDFLLWFFFYNFLFIFIEQQLSLLDNNIIIILTKLSIHKSDLSSRAEKFRLLQDWCTVIVLFRAQKHHESKRTSDYWPSKTEKNRILQWRTFNVSNSKQYLYILVYNTWNRL